MRKLHATFLTVAFAALFVGCETAETPTEASVPASDARGGPGAQSAGASYTFSGGPVFDIDAAPNGNILVPVTVLGVPGPTTVWEIRTQGRGGVREVVRFMTPETAPINGLAAIGRGSFYAARGGLDLAEHAALLHVTPGGARVVGDIERYETRNDPDRFAIEDWKDPACAPASGPFTPGPQSNPYHLAPVSGGTTLVADAAGNTLLRIERNGHIELVALFTPPVTGGGASADPADWLEFPFDGGTPNDPSDDPTEGNCYVQPVPNSVAVDGGGAIYVGELIGVGGLGLSRVWRIEPGTTNAVCPSASCEMALTGFTSIIDIAFGPDGDLYVVEYDENGWLTAFGAGTPAGGTVNRCDVRSGVSDASVACQTAVIGGEELKDLTFPAAIAFDRRGHAWLLENNLGLPPSGVVTVRRLD